MSIYTNRLLEDEMRTVNSITTPVYEAFQHYIKAKNKADIVTVNGMFNEIGRLTKAVPFSKVTNVYTATDKITYIVPLFVSGKYSGYIRLKVNGKVRKLSFYSLNKDVMHLSQTTDGRVKIERENYINIIGKNEVEDKWADYIELKTKKVS